MMRGEALRHCFDGRGLRQHADFHRSNIEIGKHRIDLRPDKIGRDIVDGAHTPGVLGGQRRDDRSSIDAERRESLEIGLDARAAARIRTRNGNGDRGHGRSRRASAPSTTARKFCAATAGSGASESADITATPSAPAAMTSAALSELMPAMAQIGNFGCRARTMSTMARRPLMPIGGAVLSFDVVPYTPPTAT